MRLASWVVHNIKIEPGQCIFFDEIYKKYQQSANENGETIVEKSRVSKFVKAVFPASYTGRKRHSTIPGKSDTVCYGITWKADLTHICLFDKHILIDTLLPHYSVTISENDVKVSLQTDYINNNNHVLKEITFKNDLTWTLKVGIKEIDLNLLEIDNTYSCVESDVLNTVYIVNQLRICTGRNLEKGDTINTNYQIQNEWACHGDENSNQVTISSKSCKRIIPFAFKLYCDRCRHMIIGSSSIPDKKSFVNSNENNHVATLKEIIPNASPEMLELFDSQCQNSAKADARARRWSKPVIQLCLTLWIRSPRCYTELRNSNALILPSERLLIAYKNSVKQMPGFLPEIFKWMTIEATRLKIPPEDMYGGILLDEMSIQEDLQIVKSGDGVELIGFVDMGDEAKTMREITDGKHEKQLADHVLQFQYLGLSGFRFPFAHFPCRLSNPAEIYISFHEAVHQLEMHGFNVLYTSLDGASTNRAFKKMHFPTNYQMETMTATSSVDNSKKIVFIMDFSHTIKKIRNNIYKSGSNSHCTRQLTLCNGDEISWKQWEAAYRWDSTNPLSIHQKLSKEHVHLTTSSKMRNHLAEEVLDANMLNLFLEYRSTVANNHPALNGIIELLKHTSKLISNFRDMRPITDLSDMRLDENRAALKWFQDWESETNALSLSAVERSKRLMSHECREDLASTIIGFEELCRLHISTSTGASITPARINSDAIENHFSQQRGLHNGAATNPNYLSYKNTVNSIILGQSAISRKSNVGKMASGCEPYAFNSPNSLSWRKKKCTSESASTVIKKIRL